MWIDSANLTRCFKSFTITDCAIRSGPILYFVAVSDYDTDDSPPPDYERRTRVVVCFADKPMDKRWRLMGYEGLSNLIGAVAAHPLEQFVGVDIEGQVLSIGSGQKGIEASIPFSEKGPLRGGVRKLRSVAGHVYACSGYRGLARRQDSGQWLSLCDNLAFTPDRLPSTYGFEDFDAFSPGDIYCAGGEGDLWHRGRNGWCQIDFPQSELLSSVCCAGDGFVYLGSQGGSVWKGRENHWQLIQRDSMTLPFKDMVWFGGRVWCTSDYGLWQVDGDRVIPAKVPDSVSICAGNLDATDDYLLVTGVYGAALFDGQTWANVLDYALLD